MICLKILVKRIDINKRDYFLIKLSNDIFIELPKTNIKKNYRMCSTIIIAQGRGQKINNLKYRKDKFND